MPEPSAPPAQPIPGVPSGESALPEPTTHPTIVGALEAIPKPLLMQSGSVFYTGRAAFAAASTLYILGLNPGGDPVAQAAETIGSECRKFLCGPARWSEYADESWNGAPRGRSPLQKRMLHLLGGVDLDPQAVPASNVVFVRSSTEATLSEEMPALLRSCWPVHEAVIDALGVRVVLCLGGTAGRWVRDALAAYELVDHYEEKNLRRWRSETHRAIDGRQVLTLTHPGRANWCNPFSDPTPLVLRALAYARG